MMSLTIDTPIATVVLDRPPVNAINEEWLDRFDAVLDRVADTVDRVPDGVLDAVNESPFADKPAAEWHGPEMHTPEKKEKPCRNIPAAPLK